MKRSVFQWLAIGLIVETGILHLYRAPQEFVEAQYLGILFVINFLGAIYAALKIFSNELWGWIIGLVVVLGSAAGYILSRTVGLPGMEIEPWLDPIGLTALAVEGFFIIALISSKPWKGEPDEDPAASIAPGTENPARIRHTPAIFALLGVILVSWLAYQWSERPGTVAMMDTELISQQELQAKYGLNVNLVGITALGSIIDLRFSILDADKAASLLDDPERMPALLIEDGDQNMMIMPARMSRHSEHLKTGGLYIMFFPNKQSVVHSGSQVSLVFGDIQLEPVITQ